MFCPQLIYLKVLDFYQIWIFRQQVIIQTSFVKEDGSQFVYYL